MYMLHLDNVGKNKIKNYGAEYSYGIIIYSYLNNTKIVKHDLSLGSGF